MPIGQGRVGDIIGLLLRTQAVGHFQILIVIPYAVDLRGDVAARNVMVVTEQIVDAEARGVWKLCAFDGLLREIAAEQAAQIVAILTVRRARKKLRSKLDVGRRYAVDRRCFPCAAQHNIEILRRGPEGFQLCAGRMGIAVENMRHAASKGKRLIIIVDIME